MTQNKDTKKELLKYFKQHSFDDWFSKYYGGLFAPTFVQGYLAIVKANARPDWAMPHGLLFQNWTGEREFNWFWKVSEMLASREKLFSGLERDLDFGERFVSEYEAGFKEFDRAAREENRIKLEDLSNEAIVEHLLNIIEQAGKQGIGYIVDCLLTNSAETDWYSEYGRKFSGRDLSEDELNILHAPVKTSFVNQVEILKLQAACQKEKNKDADKIFEQLVRNYYWVENNYLKIESKTRQNFIDEVEKINDPCGRLVIEQERLARNLKVKKDLLDKIKASALMRAFVKLADDFAFIQDSRKQCVLRLNHFIFKYYNELARRLKFDPKLIFYIIHFELEDFLKNPAAFRSLVKERQAGCLVVLEIDRWAIFPRDELAGIDLSNFFKDYSKITEARGTPACAGKVRGEAKVILGSDQFGQFKKGDILITNQTTPDFMPLFKKAGAVIAEQGGITSHAAVVSRELGIPCIVGVKDAMAIFKGGGKVEVDAEQGIVRKLSK